MAHCSEYPLEVIVIGVVSVIQKWIKETREKKPARQNYFTFVPSVNRCATISAFVHFAFFILFFRYSRSGARHHNVNISFSKNIICSTRRWSLLLLFHSIFVFFIITFYVTIWITRSRRLQRCRSTVHQSVVFPSECLDLVPESAEKKNRTHTHTANETAIVHSFAFIAIERSVWVHLPLHLLHSIPAHTHHVLVFHSMTLPTKVGGHETMSREDNGTQHSMGSLFISFVLQCDFFSLFSCSFGLFVYAIQSECESHFWIRIVSSSSSIVFFAFSFFPPFGDAKGFTIFIHSSIRFEFSEIRK